ncbi:MAG TPA: TVP38/TMEM64 family protein [Thermoanaerobaculia bacterium]|nr:TVP38/TMEM64 family protein [Thermoanaerobaculia bacterium]
MTTSRLRRLPWKWIAVGLLLAGVIAASRFLPVGEWVRAFSDWAAGFGLAGKALYALVYAVATVLLFPASLLTIAAGFAFGLGWGIAIVWVGATAGAALAFLIARHLARERVEKAARRKEDFRAIDRAVGEKGWKIVALLRLSPLVPFSLSNYLYGLTAIRFGPYLLASAAGMLPGTVLYVYLGVAGRAAAAASAGEKRSPLEWAALAAGLAATVVATVLITRIARSELRKVRLEKKAS